MSTSTADAIVVGCGPAGATTALLLARAGHDVVLLERASLPRPKPCGDCLSAGATDVLRRLDLLEAVQPLPHGSITEWRISAPGGERFTGAVPHPPGFAMAIERRVLDQRLTAAAVAAGARLHEDVHVRDLLRDDGGAVTGVVTSRGAFRGRLVVGADGLRSTVARRLRALRRAPRLRKVSFTVHLDLPLTSHGAGEMHVLRDACIGVAPVTADAGRCNLTVVARSAVYLDWLQQDTASADGGAPGRDAARRFITAIVASVPALARRAGPALAAATPVLASGPFDQPVRRVAFAGAVLAGDAAGYYDPFTGQGVTHALHSAELLARTADGALRSNDCSAAALQPYARALRSRMRAPLLLQHAVEAVLSRPAIADHAIARLARAPGAADALIAVIGLAAPTGSLLSASVLSDLVRTTRRRAS